MVDEVAQASADISDGDQKVVQPETSVGEGEKTQDVNWEERATKAEARVTEQTARITKQADDLRSVQGQVRRQETAESVVQDLKDEFNGFQAEVRSGLKSIADGDLTTMNTDMETARAPHATRAQSNSVVRIAASRMADFEAELVDGAGTALLDAKTAPELQDARETFDLGIEYLKQGQRAQAEEHLGRAINLASRAGRVAERAVGQKPPDAQEAATKAAVAAALAEVGAEDLSTGSPSAGGGALEGEALDEAVGAGTIEMTPEVVKKLNEHYKKVGFRR